MNAAIVEIAGILKLKRYHMVNIKMWYHPKYYKELRKRNKSDQVISLRAATAGTGVHPGPGQQHQASSAKLKEPQASSGKHQAPSSKRQA